MKQTETLALVFHKHLRFDVYPCLTQVGDVFVVKQFALALDDGHCAVVCTQQRQKFYVMFARLSHVGKHNAVVCHRKYRHIDCCYRAGKSSGKVVQFHRTVAKHRFCLSKYLHVLCRNLPCDLGLALLFGIDHVVLFGTCVLFVGECVVAPVKVAFGNQIAHRRDVFRTGSILRKSKLVVKRPERLTKLVGDGKIGVVVTERKTFVVETCIVLQTKVFKIVHRVGIAADKPAIQIVFDKIKHRTQLTVVAAYCDKVGNKPRVGVFGKRVLLVAKIRNIKLVEHRADGI